MSHNQVTIPLLQRMSLGENLLLYINSFPNEAYSIATIFFPLVLIGVVSYLRSLFSMIFLGSLDSTILAGSSLAIASANITGYSLFSGLTAGAETICSQAFGAKRYKLFRATIRRGTILLLITSLPVLLVWIDMDWILTMLKQDKKLASIAHTFLIYSIPDLVARSFLYPLKAYFKTQSKTVPLGIRTAVASVLHFLILLLFVSYFRLKVIGVALSGGLSHFILDAFLFIYYIKQKLGSDEEEEVTEEESYEDSGREWTKLIGLAVPSCGMVCFEFWFYEIMILICGVLENPEVALASMGIIMQLTSLLYILHDSLSSAVSTRVGSELGSNRPHAARRAAILGLLLSILLGIVACIFIFSIRNVWATFFTVDEEVIESVSNVLQIVSLCEVGNCTQTTVCGVLKGSARQRVGALINAAAFYGVGLPVGYVMVFPFGYGVMGLWYGMSAAQITCVIGTMVAMFTTDWELEAERARELTSVDNCRRDGDVEDVEAEGLISRVESLSE